MQKKLGFLLAFFMALPSFISAGEIRILDKHARSMGMGGVGVSSFGYTFSPMANPAALGLMSDYTMVPIIDLGIVLNNETTQLIGDVQAIAGGTHFTNINFDKYIGKAAVIGLGGPFTLGFMGKGFGIWMNMGTDVMFGVFHPENSPLAGVKISTVLNTIDQVSNIVNNNGGSFTPSTATQVEEALKNGIYQDLLNSGLSQAQIFAQANTLLNSIAGTSGAPVDYIDPATGAIDTTKLNAGLVSGGTVTIAEDNLRSIIPRITAKLFADIAVNVGYGYKIPFRAMDDVSGLSLGATLRFIQRFKSDSVNNTPADQLSANLITDSLWQAFSISSDFGLSLRLENFVFAFAARDAFSAPFQWRGLLDGAAHPSTSFTPSLDMGFSYRFLFGNRWIQEVGLYFEAIDMINNDITAGQKIRLGLETKLFGFLDLRLGMYNVFVTGGVGMGGKWGRVDFAYYRQVYNIFQGYSIYGDQFNVTFTIGLENTPARKASAVAKKADRAAAAAARGVNISDAVGQ